ncbi:hypothetical protein TVAG_310980 [Trichomonas vaginalis G3]|uniref:Uncharacterized protein n=1 Tax=Trichomonas vaginalis (strain ATCC PRA-98 / G3) TaxID=412133 RepID=A2FHV3_TRIV3|nr:spectrin binding [Trichomonas vaginalis G3]EAX95526.1 hypothetical protein TVAG_310980 [Trichomonas vaginalis G3]KAI5495029.1 spectrin binding [Trichomonas vaginalis G3]|eukprot:XP_001308456.1 hypothetical protein [Trichomonas vaginalis G3]
MEQYYRLQKAVNTIENNVPDVASTIITSEFTKTTQGIQYIAHEIVQTASIRPKSIQNLSNLVAQLISKQSSENKFGKLISYILDEMRYYNGTEDNKIYPVLKFVRLLYNLNLVTIDEIKKLLTIHPEGPFTKVLHNCFIPEIGLQVGVIHPWPKSIISETWDELAIENFNGYIMREGDEGSINHLLRADDPSFIPDDKFNFKRQIFYPEIGKSLPLLDIAAYYASIKCFRAISAKVNQYDQEIARCAAIGGNAEILKYLQARNIPVAKQLDITIQYHNIEAFEYLNSLDDKFSNKSIVGIEVEHNFIHLLQQKPEATVLEHFTKLHNAVCGGHSFAASFVVKTIPSALNPSLTPENDTLAAAVVNNIPDVVTAYLTAFPKLVHRFPNKDSDLYSACVHERSEVIHTLLQFPVDIMQGCPCHVVALKGRLNIVKEFFERKDFDHNARNKDGLTILNAAIISGNDDLVYYIFDKYPQLEWTDTLGQTPLHCAVANQNYVLTEYFLGKGANINTQDSTGRTPLHTACALGDIGLASILLNVQGININLLTQHKRTPLHEAIKKGDIECIKALCQRDDLDPNIKDDADRTPLHEAILGGRAESVTQVLNIKNVDKSLKCKGKSAFKLAATKEMRKLVLDNGCPK